MMGNFYLKALSPLRKKIVGGMFCQAYIFEGVMKVPALCRIILEVGNYELSFSNISEVLENRRASKRKISVTYMYLNHPDQRLVDINLILC